MCLVFWNGGKGGLRDFGSSFCTYLYFLRLLTFATPHIFSSPSQTPLFSFLLFSGHGSWFEHNKNTLSKIFVASNTLKNFAIDKYKIDPNNVILSGLPIRKEFTDESKHLKKSCENDRYSESGLKYQLETRKGLGIINSEMLDKPVILIVNGGEGGGVSKLIDVVETLYKKLKEDGISASIIVVCGRNKRLLNKMEGRIWGGDKHRRKRRFVKRLLVGNGKKLKGVLSFFNPYQGVDKTKQQQDTINPPNKATINVIQLPFITNMEKLMVASTILISKAGPGTIAEATALGLPIMLTSYLPGQEKGNVNFVVDGGFGEYVPRNGRMAERVSSWLLTEGKLQELSRRSIAKGRPEAAKDIAEVILESAFRLRELNDVDVAADTNINNIK